MLEAAGLGSASESHCRRDRARLLETAASASVIVATRERPDQLKRCLDSLLEQDFAPAEIIVVDSGPTSNATHNLVRRAYDGTVVYIRVDRPGLALAHNVAMRASTGSIVAFIDDDVVADRLWLTFLVAGFAADTNVGCTTGLILPLQLETRAQSWTVSHSRLDKGFVRRIFDVDENRPPEPLYPYTAGVFGSGTNMAFSAAFLHENGGFDTSLGVGTVTRGGDDLAAFFDVIARGYRLVYEPGAIVWHEYRRDDSALARHFFSYGMGLSAYLTRTVAQHPRRLVELGRLLPRGVAHMMRIRSRDTLGGLPRHFVRREWAGMIVGPFAYVVSRRRSSRDTSGSDKRKS
jgi:GT2 family glycosyltransferase